MRPVGTNQVDERARVLGGIDRRRAVVGDADAAAEIDMPERHAFGAERDGEIDGRLRRANQRIERR